MAHPEHPTNPEHQSLENRQSELAAELQKVEHTRQAITDIGNELVLKYQPSDKRPWQTRRTNIMTVSEHFDPNVASPKDNRIIYNLLSPFRGESNTASSYATVENNFRDKLEAIRQRAFGERQPRTVSKTEVVHGQHVVLEWKGAPIGLGLADRAKDSMTDSQERGGSLYPDLMLIRGGDEKWYLAGQGDEMIAVPDQGIHLGREAMSIPGFKITMDNLANDKSVSRSHLTLRPVEGGIEISDHSTNGTMVAERYIDAPEDPRAQAAETQRQGLLAKARSALRRN